MPFQILKSFIIEYSQIKNIKMKNLIAVIICFFLLQAVVAQSSWKSPEYQPQTYNKVLVIAKISDELDKRKLEDATVALLGKNGINAVHSYGTFSEADISDLAVFKAKAASLEIDAVVVFTLTGNSTEYKNTPALNMNVGVPLHLGIFSTYLGTNVPLAGGTSKQVIVVNATVTFYNKTSDDMQWSAPLKGRLKNDSSDLSVVFSKAAVKAMLKDKLFAQ
jgi:hypothetical protein